MIVRALLAASMLASLFAPACPQAEARVQGARLFCAFRQDISGTFMGMYELSPAATTKDAAFKECTSLSLALGVARQALGIGGALGNGSVFVCFTSGTSSPVANQDYDALPAECK
jgi:hypothetical protein